MSVATDQENARAALEACKGSEGRKLASGHSIVVDSGGAELPRLGVRPLSFRSRSKIIGAMATPRFLQFAAIVGLLRFVIFATVNGKPRRFRMALMG